MIDKLYKLLVSLFFYGFFYSLSYLFYLKCDESIARKDYKSEKLYAMLGTLILCIFAGMRANTVGTDVQMYAIPTYNSAKVMGFIPFLQANSGMPIYCILAYIAARLFGSFHVFLFLIELTIILPIYKYARYNKDVASVSHVMLLYMLLFYPMSFNIMRQSMASAVLLLGSYFLLNNKFPRFCICAIIAILMHNTAAIGIIIMLVACALAKMQSKRKVYAIQFLLVLMILAVVKYWVPVVNWMIYTMHILPSKFSYYVTVFSETTIGKEGYFIIGAYDYVSIILKALFLIASYRNIKGQSNAGFYVSTLTVSYSLYAVGLVAFHTSFSYRISMYTDYILIYTMAVGLIKQFHSFTKIPKKNLVILGLAFAYFLLIYFYFGAHGAVPYKVG